MTEKLNNAVGIYGNYHVDQEDYLKGKINHIVIWADSRMLTKPAIDTAFEVIDKYQEKYESMCICGTIQTRPYLMSDGVTFLHMPVIEVGVRIYEER